VGWLNANANQGAHQFIKTIIYINSIYQIVKRTKQATHTNYFSLLARHAKSLNRIISNNLETTENRKTHENLSLGPWNRAMHNFLYLKKPFQNTTYIYFSNYIEYFRWPKRSALILNGRVPTKHIWIYRLFSNLYIYINPKPHEGNTKRSENQTKIQNKYIFYYYEILLNYANEYSMILLLFSWTKKKQTK